MTLQDYLDYNFQLNVVIADITSGGLFRIKKVQEYLEVKKDCFC